jgi:hypothetical protein
MNRGRAGRAAAAAEGTPEDAGATLATTRLPHSYFWISPSSWDASWNCPLARRRGAERRAASVRGAASGEQAGGGRRAACGRQVLRREDRMEPEEGLLVTAVEGAGADRLARGGTLDNAVDSSSTAFRSPPYSTVPRTTRPVWHPRGSPAFTSSRPSSRPSIRQLLFSSRLGACPVESLCGSCENSSKNNLSRDTRRVAAPERPPEAHLLSKSAQRGIVASLAARTLR